MNLQQTDKIGVLRLFETTKTERGDFALQVIESIEEGRANPIDLHLQLKCMEDIIKRITGDDTFREMLVEEVQKYGKTFEHHNAKFEVKEVGTKYDYSQCNDPELAELEARVEEYTGYLKSRQKFLQTVPANGMEIITQYGEAITIYPPSKTSTTSVTVTLK